MKISMKWMADFFPHLNIEKDFEPKLSMLREKLPLSGIEIGFTGRLDKGLENVVVAQIDSFAKHPNADRLNVCQVKTGNGAEVLQIVCGASNVRAGMKVALAKVGANLPNGLSIKKGNIRNVESNGMLCSESELGFAEESSGIIDLPESYPLGSPLAKVMGLQDEVWEAELTPDRADCLSHMGLAREFGRLLSTKPKLPEIEQLGSKESQDVVLMNVEVIAKKACPLYTGLLLDGVDNRPSPDWLKRRLKSIGAKSHSSAVDVTNFVLFEIGHPLHAFDADKIVGSRIIVRFAKDGESLLTLDGIERKLSSEDLVIADLEGPVALAGVMGGLNSAVTEKTKRIFLESAVFDPAVIRASSQRHKIHSEASHRFERSVDAQNCSIAAGRASLLFKQLTNARRRGAYVQIVSDRGQKMLEKYLLHLDLRVFKDVIGLDAKAEEIVTAFGLVDIEAELKSPNVLKVKVPTHRHDLSREIDLIEEAARLLGFERIGTRYPEQIQRSESKTGSVYWATRRIRNRMLETGLTEMQPYTFISESQKAFLGSRPCVELANPLSDDWKYLRPNLFFGQLGILARHAALGQLRGGFFETGSVFEVADASEVRAAEAAETIRSSGTKEHFHVAWSMLGPRSSDHWSTDKGSADRKAHVDFFDAKGICENLVDGLSVFGGRWKSLQYISLMELPDNLKEQLSNNSWVPLKLLHPGRSALLTFPGAGEMAIVGFVGELHPSYKNDLLNLPAALQLGVCIGEINTGIELTPESKHYKAEIAISADIRGSIGISRKLPLVHRDFAFVFDTDVKASELIRAVKKAVPGPELIDVEYLDLYKMSEEKKSLALRMTLQGVNDTFAEADIQKICDGVLKVVKTQFKGELRS